MVKKVEGNRPTNQSPASAVEGSTAVGAAKIGSVNEVAARDKLVQAGRARRPTRPMTAAERDHLFRLIHEEADKMFGEDGIPPAKRETVEGAVRMAIDGAIVDEEQEKKK